jgi:cyclopropane-fatty-acyl-phospholipid synthase
MRKYMWPNSCLPSPTVLINAARTGARGRFALDSVENHSARACGSCAYTRKDRLMPKIDYARTLREWNRRLDANLTQELLAADFPSIGVDRAAFEAFMRKWRYFFAYAGSGFVRGYISCHMLSFIREVCLDLTFESFCRHLTRRCAGRLQGLQITQDTVGVISPTHTRAGPSEPSL